MSAKTNKADYFSHVIMTLCASQIFYLICPFSNLNTISDFITPVIKTETCHGEKGNTSVIRNSHFLTFSLKNHKRNIKFADKGKKYFHEW